MRIRALHVAAAAAALAMGGAATAGRQESAPVSIVVKVVLVESGSKASDADLDAVLKAGGKTLSSPTVRTLDEKPAQINVTRELSYTVPTGDKSAPTRTAKVTVGMELKLVPHANADGSIQLDVDLVDSEPGPGGPPVVFRQGFFNSLRVQGDKPVRFGFWARGGKTFTAYASATVEKL